MNERLRISIVEWDVPNQEYGYFVVIGENVEITTDLVSKLPENKEIRYIGINQRIHRMKPNKGSVNLSNFKKEVEKFGCYHIVPAQQIEDPEKGIGYRIELDYKILKRKIEFRNYNEIPESNDPDCILKSEGIINHKF